MPPAGVCVPALEHMERLVACSMLAPKDSAMVATLLVLQVREARNVAVRSDQVAHDQMQVV